MSKLKPVNNNEEHIRKTVDKIYETQFRTSEKNFVAKFQFRLENFFFFCYCQN